MSDVNWWLVGGIVAGAWALLVISFTLTLMIGMIKDWRSK